MNTDRIEKRIVLRAPHERVWRAIVDSKQFGSWFGVAFDGPFVEGARITGKITPTTVDADIAKLQQPHAGTPFTILIERIEPMQTFAFRWHPYAMDPGLDYSKEPTTLVAFALESVPAGTQLTICETGFDQIPLDRRAKAFSANDGGWTMQTTLIEKYLALNP
jgi:uncharacterized protein YndB with AHSA1/START domain